MKYELYKGNKTYLYPNMEIASPERVLSDYPGILTFKHLIKTNDAGEVLYAVENLNTLRSKNVKFEELSDDEFINKLNEKIKEQELLSSEPQVEEPTAEERIAAALEFQNLQSL